MGGFGKIPQGNIYEIAFATCIFCSQIPIIQERQKQKQEIIQKALQRGTESFAFL